MVVHGAYCVEKTNDEEYWPILTHIWTFVRTFLMDGSCNLDFWKWNAVSVAPLFG